MNIIFKRCLKFLRHFFIGGLMGFFIAIIALQVPMVQRKILDKVLSYASHKTGYQVTCHRLSVYKLYKFCLHDVHVQDAAHRPIVNISQLYIELKLIRLLLCKQNCINFVCLARSKVYLSTSLQANIDPSVWFRKIFLSSILKTKSSWFIDRIHLHDVDFLYYDALEKLYKPKQRCNLQLSNVNIVQNGYMGQVTGCSLQDVYHKTFLIKAFTTQFVIKPYKVLLKQCNLLTTHSHVKGDVCLNQEHDLLLFSDIKTLNCDVRFDQTELSTVEWRSYVKLFLGQDKVKLDGRMTWSWPTMAWENFKLDFSKSFVKSSGTFNKTSDKIDVFLDEGVVYVDDLRFYCGKLLNNYTKALQCISFSKSTLKGTPTQFKWIGAMHTNLGDLKANLTLQAHNRWRFQELNYDGKIALSNFALHKVVNSLPITSLSGECVMKSKGKLSDKTMELGIKLTTVQTPAYGFKDIDVLAELKKDLLSFNVDSKDPYAKLCFSGSYDLKNHLLAHGSITSIDLNNFSIGSKMPFRIGTNFSMDLYDVCSGFPKGQIQFKQCRLSTLKQSGILNNIMIYAHSKNHKHLLALKSDWADIQFSGWFPLDALFGHMAQFVEHLKNPKSKIVVSKILHVDYRVNLKKAFLSSWVCEHIDVSPLTTLMGKFSFYDTYAFSLNSSVISSMRFKQIYFKNAKFALVLQKLDNPKQRVFRFKIFSEEQDWYQKFKTDHLNFQVTLDQDRLAIEHLMAVDKDKGDIRLVCSGIVQEGLLQIQVLPSVCMIYGKKWHILEDKPIKITKDTIEVGHIYMVSGKALVSIGGNLMQKSCRRFLNIRVRNVALEDFCKLNHIKGSIYADLSSDWQSDNFVVNGQVNLHDCVFYNHPIGMMQTKINWNSLENKLFIESLLKKGSAQLLKLFGYYLPFQVENSLHLTAQLKAMDLYFLNLITGPVFSQIEGKLTGKFHVTGTLPHPKLNGIGVVRQGKICIDYLNTLYKVDLDLRVKDNICDIDFINLKDSKHGKARLKGHIFLKEDFPLKLSGKIEHLQLLNTIYQHGTSIFGSLYATGNLDLQGPIKKLSCNLSATVEQGAFTVLIQDDHGFQYNNLIHFTKKQVAPLALPAQPVLTTSSIDACFDLSILPDVKTKVVFGSSKNKDYIEGSGKGHLQFKVGTHREPYIEGHFFLQEGLCTISVFDLFKREFNILSDSKISFNGYPRQAIASINASHRQMVALSPLTTSKTVLVPIDIVFNLSGQLAFPCMTYKFLFTEKSDDTSVNVFLDQCYSKSMVDRFYLNKQILSILLSKRIYDDQEKISVWDAFSKSVDDILSQQIKQIASKVDKNLDFEVDLGLDQWSKSTFINSWQQIKIGVNYQFGKYRISSKLGGVSNLFNDWQIDYYISKSLSAKAYLHALYDFNKNSSCLGFGLVYRL